MCSVCTRERPPPLPLPPSPLSLVPINSVWLALICTVCVRCLFWIDLFVKCSIFLHALDILHLFQTIIIFSIPFIALFINNRSYLNNASLFFGFVCLSLSNIKGDICWIYPLLLLLLFLFLFLLLLLFFLLSSHLCNNKMCLFGPNKVLKESKWDIYKHSNGFFAASVSFSFSHSFTSQPNQCVCVCMFIFFFLQMTDYEWIQRVGYDLMAVCWSFYSPHLICHSWFCE